ncbi:TonB-dependent receptor [Sphingomonas sp.]|uniref:TonB-dependent receptor domain-containing protein n=1 Tax=Sphingomonas sp. TaxID=28214 RepID=UPI0025E9D4AA|nr:TonB-dependent receptor [Sphingomonas sp.]
MPVGTAENSPTLNNPFCGLFRRNATATTGPGGEVPFQILEGSLLQSSANFAALQTRGIDFDIAYRKQFDFGTVNTHFVYTHVLQNDSFTDPARPDYADRTLGELGYPKDQFVWNVNLAMGPFEFGYKMRYIGSQFTGAAENVVSVQGRPPENEDYSSPSKSPAVFHHDLQIGINVEKNFNFYMGVENIADKKPPLGSLGIGAGSGIQRSVPFLSGQQQHDRQSENPFDAERRARLYAHFVASQHAALDDHRVVRFWGQAQRRVISLSPTRTVLQRYTPGAIGFLHGASDDAVLLCDRILVIIVAGHEAKAGQAQSEQ